MKNLSKRTKPCAFNHRFKISNFKNFSFYADYLKLASCNVFILETRVPFVVTQKRKNGKTVIPTNYVVARKNN